VRAQDKLPGDAIFRANPQLQAVVVDRLTAPERAVLGARLRNPDVYGVLRPRGDGPPSVKVIDRDTALLFLTLAEPGPMPRFVRDALGPRADAALARLVLDQVLEIERDGRFVSGPGALEIPALRAPPIPSSADESRLARMSRAALHYGEALQLDDAPTLAARLYGYNRQPVSPDWARRLATRAAVGRHWGLERRALRAALGRDWMGDGGTDGAWLSWWSGRAPPQARCPFKLYVSPVREHAAEALAAAVAAFTRGRAHAFKIAADVGGLHRPDKLVAYFDDRADLQQAAERVGAALAACPAQGVPFTADAGGDGLVSWGMDPPPDGGTAGESWRSWLAGRLALAMVAARRDPAAGVAPADFALERIRLEGVDPRTWAPIALPWAAGA
jgi:hypothetical protein